MPVKRAAIKALRQNRKRRARNLAIKNELKSAVKNARKLLALADKNKAAEAISQAIRKLDRASQKGVIKKNTAARIKSRLAKALNRLT